MNPERSLEDSIRLYVESMLARNKQPEGIPMSAPTFGVDEIVEAIDSLVTQNVTMGAKVEKFEQMFADYLGVKHAIMVNSGSSANLLMMSVASNPAYGGRLMPGDEVIVPALTWSTTIWPVIQNHLHPVLVDCDPDTLCIDVDKIEITERTKAICVAHILGNGCDMDALVELAEKHRLILLEDNCESLGTKYKGRQLGTFGAMGTFSFFFSHHITTIEGGMVVTDNDRTADLLRCLRAHGWTRHMHDRSIEKRFDIDPRFMFANIGYSVRPTEIQGAFGIHQLPKLDGFNRERQKTAMKIRSKLAHLPVRFTQPTEGVEHTWFGFPMFCDDREGLMAHLNKMNIDTRPIIAGNMARHPAMELFPWSAGDLSEADRVMDEGFYVGAVMDDVQVDYLAAVIEQYYR